MYTDIMVSCELSNMACIHVMMIYQMKQILRRIVFMVSFYYLFSFAYEYAFGVPQGGVFGPPSFI